MQNTPSPSVSCLLPAAQSSFTVCPISGGFKSTAIAGQRTGRWVFFDDKGVKTHEIDFVNDNFDGERVEFHPNGQRKAIEIYARGILAAPATVFDERGTQLTLTR